MACGFWQGPTARRGRYVDGRVAQLVESLVYTEDLGGSSPSSPTTNLPFDRALALATLHRAKGHFMPAKLDGSCRCGAVRFSANSHTPVPYQLCYCSICHKQQGGGGYAINLGADARSLMIEGEEHLGLYRARIEEGEHPTCRLSSGERHFCRLCGSALWLYDPSWPELVHPFASAIDKIGRAHV